MSSCKAWSLESYMLATLPNTPPPPYSDYPVQKFLQSNLGLKDFLQLPKNAVCDF